MKAMTLNSHKITRSIRYCQKMKILPWIKYNSLIASHLRSMRRTYPQENWLLAFLRIKTLNFDFCCSRTMHTWSASLAPKGSSWSTLLVITLTIDKWKSIFKSRAFPWTYRRVTDSSRKRIILQLNMFKNLKRGVHSNYWTGSYALSGESLSCRGWAFSTAIWKLETPSRLRILKAKNTINKLFSRLLTLTMPSKLGNAHKVQRTNVWAIPGRSLTSGLTWTQYSMTLSSPNFSGITSSVYHPSLPNWRSSREPRR